MEIKITLNEIYERLFYNEKNYLKYIPKKELNEIKETINNNILEIKTGSADLKPGLNIYRVIQKLIVFDLLDRETFNKLTDLDDYIESMNISSEQLLEMYSIGFITNEEFESIILKRIDNMEYLFENYYCYRVRYAFLYELDDLNFINNLMLEKFKIIVNDCKELTKFISTSLIYNLVSFDLDINDENDYFVTIDSMLNDLKSIYDKGNDVEINMIKQTDYEPIDSNIHLYEYDFQSLLNELLYSNDLNLFNSKAYKQYLLNKNL